MGKIVALVGMCGSGKSVVSEMFESLGWKKVYFGGVTMKELEKRGLERCEKNERMIREELRKTYGQAAFAILLVDEIRELSKENNVILDGLYSWDEYKVLKNEFGDELKVVAVVTNSELRYSRLATRTIRPLTRAEAVSRDHSEIENLAKGGPIAIADYYMPNNSDLDSLTAEFEKFIKLNTEDNL